MSDTEVRVGDQPADGAAVNALFGEEGRLVYLRWQTIYAMLLAACGGVVDLDDRRVVDAYASVSREVGLAMRIAAATADRQVDLAIEVAERLPQVAALVRDGIISAAAFGDVVLETRGVEDAEAIEAIDAATAAELREDGAVSRSKAAQTARRMVAEFDPDRVREQRRSRGKGVHIAHEADGSDVVVSTTPEDASLVDANLTSVADEVCEKDPRSRTERRHDAAIALLSGGDFQCGCGDPECPAATGDEAIATRFAKIVLHVIADRSTVDGDSDKAGWMDGFGVIDAHHVREIAARRDTVLRPLDLGGLAGAMAQPGNPYRPTAACDTAVRAVFGTCSEPGCDRPAWRSDLDHVCEYNHDDPAAGGATCVCNLTPKCRLHHLYKTFADGWVDDQIVDANGVIWTEITAPSGYTVRSRARNHWLLPDLGLVPCSHGEPVAPGAVTEPAPERSRTRAQARHDYRMRIRSQRRYALACAAAASHAVFDTDDEPPF